jgi:hypothetical protein
MKSLGQKAINSILNSYLMVTEEMSLIITDTGPLKQLLLI